MWLSNTNLISIEENWTLAIPNSNKAQFQGQSESSQNHGKDFPLAGFVFSLSATAAAVHIKFIPWCLKNAVFTFDHFFSRAEIDSSKCLGLLQVQGPFYPLWSVQISLFFPVTVECGNFSTGPIEHSSRVHMSRGQIFNKRNVLNVVKCTKLLL